MSAASINDDKPKDEFSETRAAEETVLEKQCQGRPMWNTHSWSLPSSMESQLSFPTLTEL